MKIKTINKVITKKFDEFCASIENEQVRSLVEKNSLISGGCIASMLLKEKVNDFDIYFTNKETVLAVANHYASKFGHDAVVVDVDSFEEFDPNMAYYAERGFREPGRVGIFCKAQSFDVGSEEEVETVTGTVAKAVEEKDGSGTYEVLFISPNAISLSDKIQIILRFYGTPEEIHANYDYVHATNYWLSKDKKLYLNQPALESILARELVYIGSKYPIASILRTRKFVNRGWTINAGMYLKMAWQVSELNLKDIAVLEDQLVGVDVMYFIMVLDALKAAKEAHKNDPQPFTFSYAYISEIVDRIF